jgi:TIR domain
MSSPEVFVSYSHEDQAWVQTLVENLHRQGVDVFYDEWDIAPGDVFVHRLEEGILAAASGILIVSPDSMRSPWVREEYAAMLARAVAGRQRLIPVLLDDVELPPFLATRVWVDFRGADGPEYERRVHDLVAALRGGPSRPDRDGGLTLPGARRRGASGRAVRPERRPPPPGGGPAPRISEVERGGARRVGDTHAAAAQTVPRPLRPQVPGRTSRGCRSRDSTLASWCGRSGTSSVAAGSSGYSSGPCAGRRRLVS